MLSQKDFDDSWQAIEGHISKRKKQKRNRFIAGSTMAAAAIFILMFNIYNPTTVDKFSGENVTDLVLHDHSKVYLNKNSTLEYPESFDNETERRVTLKGEAFFDIERKEQLPFKITVDETEIEVLGTSFNVRSRENENQIEVYVNSGKVQFTKGMESAVLTPNEIGIFDKTTETIRKKISKDPNAMAWHSKKLIFDETSFIEVEKTLYRLFGYQLKVDNANIYNCIITSTIEFESVGDVLEILEATMGATLKIEEDKILVNGDGC